MQQKTKSFVACSEGIHFDWDCFTNAWFLETTCGKENIHFDMTNHANGYIKWDTLLRLFKKQKATWCVRFTCPLWFYTHPWQEPNCCNTSSLSTLVYKSVISSWIQWPKCVLLPAFMVLIFKFGNSQAIPQVFEVANRVAASRCSLLNSFHSRYSLFGASLFPSQFPWFQPNALICWT